MKHDAMLYRTDIQGIRALAVLSVIAYHLPFSFVSGGFIGVDIFFVLSGYVIAASSLKFIGTGEWRAVFTFYEKRARRLFPALVFAVILGVTAIAILVPPDNSKLEGLRTGLFSISGLANYYLLSVASDYWKEGEFLNPFRHMWSLGVEFQYYAAFPIIGVLYFRFLTSSPLAKSLSLAAIVMIATASLVAYLSGATYELKQFYLVQYRIWQFGIGIASFLVVSKYKDTYLTNSKFVICLRRLLNEITYLILIILLILVGVDYFSRQLLSVYSCLITGLFLVVNAKPNYSERSFLGNKLALSLGDASYSLYLIHWPVIFVFNYLVFFDTIWVYVYCLVAIFVLSYFSWFFIEYSFRRRGSQKKILTATFATMLIVFAVADNGNVVRRLPFHTSGGLSSRSDGFHNFWWVALDGANHLYTSGAKFNSERAYRVYDAQTGSYFSHVKSPLQPSNGTLIAFGDSYIESSGAMLLEYSEKNNLDLKLRHIMNCTSKNPQCRRAFDEVINLIRTETKTVFIFAAFNWPEKGHFKYRIFPELFQLATEMDVPVIIQGASPVFSGYNPKLCISPFKRSRKGCATIVPIEPMLERVSKIRSRIALLISDENRALVWKPWGLFCNLATCKNSVNGVSLLRGHSHFSVYGSLYMYDDFAAFVDEQIGSL